MTTRAGVSAWIATLAVSTPLCLASAANAQVVASSFDELRNLAKSGDILVVTDTSGRRIRGKLQELPISSLELFKTVGDGRTPHPAQSERDIREIQLEIPDSLWNGTLIGLFSAGGVFMLGCAATSGDPYDRSGLCPAALGTSAAGAGLGFLIDRLRTDRIRIYQASLRRQSAGVGVSPLVSKSERAERVARSFDELQGLVEKDDTLVVTDSRGEKTKGTLGGLSASSLELLASVTGDVNGRNVRDRRQLSEHDIREIRVERADSLRNGTLIGLGVGAGGGVLAAAIALNRPDPSCPSDRYPCDTLRAVGAFLTFLVGATVGTVSGIVTDALIKEHRVVYLPPGETEPARGAGQRKPVARMLVAPVLARGRTGVTVSLRF